jgi:hypothetical protein
MVAWASESLAFLLKPVPPMSSLLNPQFEGATVFSRSAFEDLNSLLLGILHCLQMEYTLIVWYFLLIEFLCEQICLEVQVPDRAKVDNPCKDSGMRWFIHVVAQSYFFWCHLASWLNMALRSPWGDYPRRSSHSPILLRTSKFKLTLCVGLFLQRYSPYSEGLNYVSSVIFILARWLMIFWRCRWNLPSINSLCVFWTGRRSTYCSLAIEIMSDWRLHLSGLQWNFSVYPMQWKFGVHFSKEKNHINSMCMFSIGLWDFPYYRSRFLD